MLNKNGATVSLVVDSIDHIDAVAKAAEAAGTVIPIIVEVDIGDLTIGKLWTSRRAFSRK